MSAPNASVCPSPIAGAGVVIAPSSPQPSPARQLHTQFVANAKSRAHPLRVGDSGPCECHGGFVPPKNVHTSRRSSRSNKFIVMRVLLSGLRQNFGFRVLLICRIGELGDGFGRALWQRHLAQSRRRVSLIPGFSEPCSSVIALTAKWISRNGDLQMAERSLFSAGTAGASRCRGRIIIRAFLVTLIARKRPRAGSRSIVGLRQTLRGRQSFLFLSPPALTDRFEPAVHRSG
jgi:hypothetical protein